ncbi:MAG: protein translocase subunit SecD, partial [Alphaproteobacteria bacterium]
MVQIALWKRVVIWALVALGFLFAMPNLFYDRVERHNDAVKLIERGAELTPELEAARAAWPDWLPSTIVNLGLDLRGGAQLLAEVKVEQVYADRMDALWPEVLRALREARNEIGTFRRVESAPDELRVRISKPEAIGQAVELVRALSQPVVSIVSVGARDIEVAAEGDEIVVRFTEAERQAILDRTIEQSLEIIRRRVDEVGTREPTIQRVGERRILIQVPGIGSASELKELIGTTARLTFHPVVSRTTDANANPGPGRLLLPAQDEKGVYYIVEKTPVVTGDELTDAQPSFDQNGRPSVNFRFDPSGARKFGLYTAENVGSPFA